MELMLRVQHASAPTFSREPRIPHRRLRARWLWGRKTSMTHSDTLTSDTRSTISVDGLEVEVFTTEEEAQATFATVPSYVEQQAAAFVAQTVREAGTC